MGGNEEEGFREEIFVNQFSKPQGTNPYNSLNSISIIVSQGIMLLVGKKYILKTEGTMFLVAGLSLSQ